jgi:plastocyanin
MSIRKRIWSVSVAAALAMAAARPAAAAAQPAQAQPAAAAQAVAIANFTFTPQTLTVRAGTTVTWTNKDDIPHGIAWADNAFARSKPLDTDDSYSLTLTTPGTYKYFCYIHPHMTGLIVVEAATGGKATP